MKQYKEIEHTADAGLEIWGASIEELFLHAAEGFLRFTLGCLPAATSDDESITLEADSLEDLLVAFLNELNFNLQARHCCLWPIQELRINTAATQKKLDCRAAHSLLSGSSLSEMKEVKSVTYYQLNIEKKGKMFRTRIFFDL